MSFLQKNYEIPTETRYISKFPQGNTKFRILSSAIVGWEYWNTDNKPVRSKEPVRKRPTDIKLEDDGTFRILHFWAFVVWDYKSEEVKIMEIKQKTIMNPIKEYVDNKDWGDPKTYDITISKKGDGFDTRYTVMPSPKTEITQEVSDIYKENPVNLEMLFSGGDPFSDEINENDLIDIDKKI